MPPTAGFSIPALPTAPQFPGQLGSVRPLFDPEQIAQQTQQYLSALQSSRAAAAQQQQLQMEQNAQRSALASQAQQRTLAGAAGEREQQQFAAQFPAIQRQAALTAVPKTSVTTVRPMDNGLYEQKTVVSANGNPVETTVAPTFLPGGGKVSGALQNDLYLTAQMTPEERAHYYAMKAGTVAKPSATPYGVQKSIGPDGAVHLVPFNRSTAEFINPLTGEVTVGRLPDGYTAIPDANAPASSGGGGAGVPLVGPNYAQQAAGKGLIAGTVADATTTARAEAQKTQDFPSAIEKARVADSTLEESERAINQALAFLKANPTLATGYAQNVRIPGTPASQFNALLGPIKSAQFLTSINSIRGATGNTGIGRVMQSEIPFFTNRIAAIDPVLSPETLEENLRYLAERAPILREYAKQAFTEHFANQIKGANPQTLPPWAAPQQAQAQIPQAAIDHLRANPNLRADFDQKYGAGASSAYLQ